MGNGDNEEVLCWGLPAEKLFHYVHTSCCTVYDENDHRSDCTDNNKIRVRVTLFFVLLCIQSNEGRLSRLFSSTSAEESSDPHVTDSPKSNFSKSIKSMKSKKKNYTLLGDLLEWYSHNGLPRTVVMIPADRVTRTLLVEMQKHQEIWKKEGTAEDIQFQSAIWELVVSEIEYLLKVRIINDVR